MFTSVYGVHTTSKEARNNNLINHHGMLTITVGIIILFLFSYVALSCKSLVTMILTNALPKISGNFLAAFSTRSQKKSYCVHKLVDSSSKNATNAARNPINIPIMHRMRAQTPWEHRETYNIHDGRNYDAMIHEASAIIDQNVEPILVNVGDEIIKRIINQLCYIIIHFHIQHAQAFI